MSMTLSLGLTLGGYAVSGSAPAPGAPAVLLEDATYLLLEDGSHFLLE
jgi:hypothetical protein